MWKFMNGPGRRRPILGCSAAKPVHTRERSTDCSVEITEIGCQPCHQLRCDISLHYTLCDKHRYPSRVRKILNLSSSVIHRHFKHIFSLCCSTKNESLSLSGRSRVSNLFSPIFLSHRHPSFLPRTTHSIIRYRASERERWRGRTHIGKSILFIPLLILQANTFPTSILSWLVSCSTCNERAANIFSALFFLGKHHNSFARHLHQRAALLFQWEFHRHPQKNQTYCKRGFFRQAKITFIRSASSSLLLLGPVLRINSQRSLWWNEPKRDSEKREERKKKEKKLQSRL